MATSSGRWQSRPEAAGRAGAALAGVGLAGVGLAVDEVTVVGLVAAGVEGAGVDAAAELDGGVPAEEGAARPEAEGAGARADFGASLPQAATITVAPTASALPPSPLRSTK